MQEENRMPKSLPRVIELLNVICVRNFDDKLFDSVAVMVESLLFPDSVPLI
jgi:hypothetical protein